MNRRSFLQSATATMVAASLSRQIHSEAAASNTPVFTTGSARWQKAYDAALAVLAGNVQILPRFDLPVLIEGAEYPGIWHFRPVQV